MSGYLKTATHVYDIESNESIVEMCTFDGHKHFLYTLPKGNWSTLAFTKKEKVDPVNFMMTMVKPTLDVAQKIARIQSDYMYNGSVKVMRKLRILDPSFDPPYINKWSRWQMNMVKQYNTRGARELINSCTSVSRLLTYTKALQALE